MRRVIASLMMLWMGGVASASPDTLQADIAEARQRRPEIFAHVEALRAQLLLAPPPYERRGQVTRMMKALGPEALLPLLDLIGNPSGVGQAPPRTREMLLVGALEAVGALRDARSAAVMQGILDGPEPSESITRAAAEALGQLGDDRSLIYLVAHAVSGDRREQAAIAGLAYVRRPLAVFTLASRLRIQPEDAIAQRLADAMGFSGSSWAWEALGKGRADEGLAQREELSRALCDAYPVYQGRTRETIGRALLMIHHPSLPAQLAALDVAADRALLADLQALRQRWLRSR
jgi:hypothetical protein